MLTRTPAIVLSVLTGVALELGVALVSGRREAWDSGVYWTVGLPLVLAASSAIGYLAGRRGWFWTALIIPSQVTTMLVRSGEVSGLWPLMIALSAVLGAPFLVAAFIASRLRPKAGTGPSVSISIATTSAAQSQKRSRYRQVRGKFGSSSSAVQDFRRAHLL